jgi:Mg2+ and Co2+ transporter CorA
MVELLSATGTFLAAVAALISVYAFVFDDIPQRPWDFTLVSWWMLGVILQIGAGLIGRLRIVSRIAG